MRTIQFVSRFVAFATLGAVGLFGQSRRVAITVDDLPYASGAFVYKDLSVEASAARRVNDKLLEAFRAHRIPVTGFVIQKRAESLGPVGIQILRKWLNGGQDLGNHTYSHPDFNALSTEQFEQEILEGESALAPLIQAAGKKLEFFRFPMNKTGETTSKHEAVAEFLSQHGYRVATCTIDNSDYIYNAAYLTMLASHEDANARKLRENYLAYTSIEIDYYAALNKQVMGYEPPGVMVLHDNQLNADVIEQVIGLFEQKKYEFVTLGAAQSDPAYRIPDTYISAYGPMWGYRWARELGVSVDGKLESDPPQWVIDYPKVSHLQTH